MTLYAVHPEIEDLLESRGYAITDRNVIIAAKKILEDMEEPGSVWHRDEWPEWSGRSLEEWKKLRKYCQRILSTKVGLHYRDEVEFV